MSLNFLNDLGEKGEKRRGGWRKFTFFNANISFYFNMHTHVSVYTYTHMYIFIFVYPTLAFLLGQ